MKFVSSLSGSKSDLTSVIEEEVLGWRTSRRKVWEVTHYWRLYYSSFRFH